MKRAIIISISVITIIFLTLLSAGCGTGSAQSKLAANGAQTLPAASGSTAPSTGSAVTPPAPPTPPAPSATPTPPPGGSVGPTVRFLHPPRSVSIPPRTGRCRPCGRAAIRGRACRIRGTASCGRRRGGERGRYAQPTLKGLQKSAFACLPPKGSRCAATLGCVI